MIWHHKTHSHHAKLVPNNMSVAGSSQPGFRITDSPGIIHAYFVLVPSSGFEYFSQTIIHGLSHTLSLSPVARVCYTDTPWDIALMCLPVEPVEPVNDLCWGSKKGWVIVSISEKLSGTTLSDLGLILYYVLNHTLIFKRYTVILFYLMNHTMICTQSYLDFQKVYRDTINLMCWIILWFSKGMLSQMFPNHTFLWVNDTFSHFDRQWGLCPMTLEDGCWTSHLFPIQFPSNITY